MNNQIKLFNQLVSIIIKKEAEVQWLKKRDLFKYQQPHEKCSLFWKAQGERQDGKSGSENSKNARILEKSRH
ncbi:hypothetical protein J23TS9_15930 [Paenibacillus sp. J23TS9]|nr:hypothetical protein J23TS9_15930 [Paenibacillus sp. J23TS9]